MNILTIEFWLIVVFTVVGVNRVQKSAQKKIIALIGSCLFYFLCSKNGFIFLFLFASFTYVVALFMAKVDKSKVLLIVYLSTSIGLLGYYKYLNFFVGEINRVFSYNWNLNNIIIPLGISFYILSAIGYIVDIYRKKYVPEKNYITHLLFLLYFPKMASGPIERGNIFFEKLNEWKSIDRKTMYSGLQIILFGLFKKIVIANRLSVCVDAVFACPERYSAISLLYTMLAYSIQIYCDFSGYTDIAIGISKLMGISLCENFDLPYCANSPSDFWRRWHISLSTWFRDYVYIPLGGNRRGNTNRNLIVTMLLSGIWHGANWTYLLWGLLHGVAQCVQKSFKQKKIGTLGGIVVNFIFVTCMWTFFRADSISTAITFFKGVVTFQQGIEYYYVFVPIYLVLVLGFQAYEYVKYNKHFQYVTFDMSKTYHYVIITLGIIVLLALGYFQNTAFIYSQF